MAVSSAFSSTSRASRVAMASCQVFARLRAASISALSAAERRPHLVEAGHHIGLGQRLSGQVGGFAGGFDRFLERSDVALKGGGSLDLICGEGVRGVEFPGGSVKIRPQALF